MSSPSKRAALHALIVCVVILGIGTALASAGVVKDAERFGEGVGRLIVFVALGAFGISYLAQTGRGRLALLLGILAVLGIGIAVLGGLQGSHAFAAKDRAALVLEGDRLRHPTLGFSVKSPGAAFQPAPQLAVMLQDAYRGKDAAYYAYSDTPITAALLLAVIDEPVDMSQQLAGFEKGLKSSAEKQGITVTTVEKRVEGNEGILYLTFGGAHVRMHSYASVPVPNRSPISVTVMTMSRDEHALEDVLTSLR